MTIDELRTEMLAGFATIDGRFNKIDGRLNEHDDRFIKIDDRFDKVDDRFTKIDDQFKKIDDEFSRIRAEIKAEGETTRRHFNIMVEKVNDSVKLVAEATASNSSRLENHEKRLKRLEGPRRR